MAATQSRIKTAGMHNMRATLRKAVRAFFASAAFVSASAEAIAAPANADYPFVPVPFTDVHFGDAFWAPRIEINRSVTIPFAFKKCEETGRVYNFEAAAAANAGHPYADPTTPGFPFDDTDVYKVLEGASYCLAVKYDAALDAYMDSLIAKIAAAQEKDGYLYTTRTMNPAHPHEWAGNERWVNDPSGSHELYNLGHLYEAAAAHYEATGKRNLLNIALKSADLLCDTFGPGKRSLWPGHQIVEMGLVKLYRITGERKYLDLAKFFLDERGNNGIKGDSYNQSDSPVVSQRAAEGHAVRAVYMYAGMADVAALTGDGAYLGAIDAIWCDVASSKTYITGGIGSVPEIEGFGEAYELPNETAYCETCAAIGEVYWNERMFMLHGEAGYVDMLEHALYNGLSSGVSLDGTSFFYGNPLESKGGFERQHWFGCACCPGNITRFLASVSGYQYAVRGGAVYVNLFVAGVAEFAVEGAGKVCLVQRTNYPWDGEVEIVVKPDKPADFALKLRIPCWARGNPMPGGLYSYADEKNDDEVGEKPSIEVNGKAFEVAPGSDGYATIAREWKSGDVVRLRLPMPARLVKADSRVKADAGRVAVQRGPVVYCFEEADNPGMAIDTFALPGDVKPVATFDPSLLNGVVVIRYGSAAAIPYCVWDNRGAGKMTVWVRR
jgi:uncharacterized protein